MQSILAGRRLDENQWSVDGPSDCLVPAGRPGPFRTAVRWSAGVDRLTGASERHSSGCIEFRPGAGLWTVISFQDEAAQARWADPVKAAFRLLADSGFGGERSRGWGRSEAPEFTEGMLPDLILPKVEYRSATVRERSVLAPLQAQAEPESASKDASAEGAISVPEAPPAATGEPAASTPELVAAVQESEIAVETMNAAEHEASQPPTEAAPEPQPIVDATKPQPPTEAAPEPASAGTAAPETIEPVAAEAAESQAAAETPKPAIAETVSPEATEPVAAEAAESQAAAETPKPAIAETVSPEASELVSAEAVESQASAETPKPAIAETVSPEALKPVAAEASQPQAAAETSELAIAEGAAPEVPAPVPTKAAESQAAVETPEPAGAETVAPEVPAPAPTKAAESQAAAETQEPQSIEEAVATETAAAVPEPQLEPGAKTYPHWLLSVFTPAAADTVDWRRGNYTVCARGGRVESPAGSGGLKKQIQMVAEGSVIYAEAAPRGSAADVAPDGFAHPVFRAGFALAIPLPEVH